jgi:hypothetical protein
MLEVHMDEGDASNQSNGCRTSLQERYVMRRVAVSLFALAIALAPLGASPQAADKSVTAVKGTVTAGQGSQTQPPTKQLPLNTHVSLSDTDWVATHAASQGVIQLPDSSLVTVGQLSNVQLTSFDGTSATATFVVVGKVRFQVKHPQGAAANYKFSTDTGQIAVRGTVGDIFSGPQGLQVNVYSLSDPTLPVQVTITSTGQVFTVGAGQSLVVTSVAGTATGSVTQVTNNLFHPFEEFGAPDNAAALGITGAGAASGAAAGTAAGIAAGAAAAAGIVITSNAKTPAPSATATPPIPSPTPSTTSVPITVTGHERLPETRPTAQP